MHSRVADSLYRGRVVCERLGTDLLEVDYHEYAAHPIEDVNAALGIVPKSERALRAGSPGLSDLDGMSRIQREFAASLDGPNR